MSVNFYDTVEDNLLKFSVIVSRTNGKWVLCKHKNRDTLEVPGGHREQNENIIKRQSVSLLRKQVQLILH